MSESLASPPEVYSCQASNFRLLTYTQCSDLTTRPRQNLTLCGGCACPWRRCYACLLQNEGDQPHSWIVPTSDRCAFHREHGDLAVRGKDEPMMLCATPKGTTLPEVPHAPVRRVALISMACPDASAPKQAQKRKKATLQDSVAPYASVEAPDTPKPVEDDVARAVADRMRRLTARERLLARGIADGRNPNQLSAFLRIKESSCKTLTCALYARLGIPSGTCKSSRASAAYRRNVLTRAMTFYREHGHKDGPEP